MVTYSNDGRQQIPLSSSSSSSSSPLAILHGAKITYKYDYYEHLYDDSKDDTYKATNNGTNHHYQLSSSLS